LQFPDQTAAYDVDFSFWITQAEEDAGNYPGAYDGLMEWVNGDAWPFDSTRVGVRNARDLSREHSSALMPLAQILTRSDRLAD
jgi:hypothetical protein